MAVLSAVIISVLLMKIAFRTFDTRVIAKLNATDIVVLVLSAPQNYAARKTRSVWFLIGAGNATDRRSSDVISVDMDDAYDKLPLKIKLGFREALKRFPTARWIAKVDDDVYFRQDILMQTLNAVPQHLSAVGHIRRYARVCTSGKWADPDYKHWWYPPFPNGAHGYALTRDLVELLVRIDGYEYQGEDASIGIWIYDAGLPVTFVNSDEFVASGDCSQHAAVVGHRLKPSDIVACADDDQFT